MSTFASISRLAIGAAILIGVTGCGPQEPASTGGPATIRRLSEAQYRNTIADIFGPQIVVSGRFDSIEREEGLLAVGASQAAVTAVGFERYHALARAVAAQVIAPVNRGTLVPCTPAATDGADDSCAKIFFSRAGRLLYRRALRDTELAALVGVAHAGAESRADFYNGLSYGLQALLESPDFLFMRDATVANGSRLSPFSKATRLSLLLWNSTPDDDLLKAAEDGSLDTKAGLKAAVDRMMASPHFNRGMRAFFTDMLTFDDFATLEKDAALYPAFSLAAANDAREQTLRTLIDFLITQNGDYRDLFTTRATHITRSLGMVYRIPVAIPGGWSRYEFPEGDNHVGIQSHLSFVALHSHPGKSSPTLRGKAVREVLLCQKVPAPPGTVNFDQFNDPESPAKTARERLAVHAVDAACAGCHKLTDPVGLALENFDTAGQSRTEENGVKIDTRGEIDGIPFSNGTELGKALHDNPATAACIINRFASYGLGRTVTSGEKPWVAYLEKTFTSNGYRFTDLVRRIALSEAFYAVSAPAKTSTKSAGAAHYEGKS